MNKKEGICKSCGRTLKLPDCVNKCKKTKCKNFSGGYCYGVNTPKCSFGVNGEHEIFFTNEY